MDYPLIPIQSLYALWRYRVYDTSRLSYRTRSGPKPYEVEMYRLLMERSEFDLDDSTQLKGLGIAIWCETCPDIPCMKLLRHKILSEHGIHARQRLVHMAIKGSEYRQLPAMFLALLGHNDMVDEITTLQDSNGRTALHLAATQILDCVDNPDPMTGALWFDFVSKLVLLGADVHKQDDSALSPLIALLKQAPYCNAARFTDMLQRWVHSLEVAGVDLFNYGNTEELLWKQTQPGRPLFSGHYVTSWTSGPKISDWTVQIRQLYVLNIYHLDIPPGAWPADEQDNIWTIIWTPTEEDNISPLWKWRAVDQVTLRSKESDVNQDGDTNLENSLPMKSSVLPLLFATSQDDCSEAVRLIDRCCRSFRRPRSTSQPATRRRRYEDEVIHLYAFNTWLPPCHFCLADGQLRFGQTTKNQYGDFPRSNEYERRCVKGVHNFAPHDIWQGPSGIKCNMDECRR